MNLAAQLIREGHVRPQEAHHHETYSLSQKNLEIETTSISMESFESQFESEKEIYRRGDSKITLSYSQGRNNPIVVKDTPKLRKKNSQSFHQVYEIEFSKMLQNLPKQHLITIQFLNQTSERVEIGMQYACNGELTQYLPSNVNFMTKQDKLNHLKTVKNILWNVVQGLQEIHQLGYVHRDIKPDNIVITHEGKAKICDFQLVGPIGIVDDSLCGTPEYMPPQRLNEKRNNCALDVSVDMWALGVLVYELLMGHVPYSLNEDDNIQELVNSMYGGFVSFDEDYPSYCRHLIFNLLQTNPRKRMSLQKVKKHQFFTMDFSAEQNLRH